MATHSIILAWRISMDRGANNVGDLGSIPGLGKFPEELYELFV